MSIELLEKRIEAKITEYDMEIERLKAVQEIKNCMGRYEVVHITPEEIWKTPGVFALWRPDCTVEVSLQGLIRGPEDITEYWTAMKAYSIKGAAFYHSLATSIVEVAGNCKTAKATWMTPGFECGMELQKNRPAFDCWCYGKYALDFIKNPETGDWKIWHMHYFRLSRNAYDKSFTEFAQFEHDNPPPSRPQEGDYTAYPTVYHRTISVTEDTHPFPLDPKPYFDYDGNFNAWQYGDKIMQEKYGVVIPDYTKLYNENYPERI